MAARQTYRDLITLVSTLSEAEKDLPLHLSNIEQGGYFPAANRHRARTL
jgi:hypothetical protein